MGMLRFVILLTIIWSSTLFAEDGIKPYFYRVQLAGKTSYLLGTFHEGIAANELPNFVLTELKNSKRALFEANIESLGVMGRNHLGPELSRTLSPIAWRYVCERLEPYYSKLQINRMAPWYVARQLTLLDSGSNLSQLKLMDKELIELAVVSKVDVEFLATTREHIALYQLGGPIEDIEESSQYMATENHMDLHKRITQAYRDGDTATQETLNEELPAIAREVFLDQRNQAWMPKLLAAFTKGQAFTAVGTGHLFGKMGLLSLLKSQGATVERVLDCDGLLNQGK